MDPFSMKGKRGLVVGIANDRSIAYGCAKRLREQGAELAVTYLNEKAEPYVRPLAEALKAPIVLPCDLAKAGELEAVFEKVTQSWGALDFLVHAVAYADKDELQGRFVDCSAEGFADAMVLSCHSFVKMARLAEPLMAAGGSLITLTYYGSEKVADGYGVMGPVKAALESSVRYLAAELGSKGIRVNAISSGPIKTRAASGIPRFDALMEDVVRRSYYGKAVTIEEIGNAAVYLASDASVSVTGSTYFVDGGFHASA